MSGDRSRGPPTATRFFLILSWEFVTIEHVNYALVTVNIKTESSLDYPTSLSGDMIPGMSGTQNISVMSGLVIVFIPLSSRV